MSATPPTLTRRFGLVHATALNMTNMIGIGPFITIPLLMSALGGPQAMLGWIVALVIVICDGMVWSELGAAMPGSGGSFGYLRQAFGPERLGRLMGFLFVWQFVISGPLEIASGYIGFKEYLRYIWRDITPAGTVLVIAGIGVLNIILLYRRITSIATITVALWIGTLLTVLAVMITGAMHFDHRIAFDFPAGSFNFSLGFLLGLGTASRIGVYDYLGYYDVCYIGDEVKDPGRVIPRSILISTLAVAVIYLAINLSIIGVVPWREFVPAGNHPESGFMVSVFMEKIYGSRIATVFTAMILWTAFGSVFALLLGYSRVPYAAAGEGYFFKVFSRLHPKGFPHVSLLVMGVIAILSSLVSLGMVIDALITTRILVQFIGQIAGVTLLRRRAPGMVRPYRMWLYPVPSLVALVGWIFIFATTPVKVILFGLGGLALGVVCFGIWSWQGRRWPFAPAVAAALIALIGVSNAGSAQTQAATRASVVLHDGWAIQSSASLTAGGDAISTRGFSQSGWVRTTVPATVLAALVENKTYPDPYFGMNLRSIPGASYPIGRNFANLPMPPESPFRVSWWYRTEFQLPASMRGQHVALRFDGINYRANIWLNGRAVARSDSVAGTFRLYEFDVSAVARPGEMNALAVEVFPPDADDLAITWVDWNPAPPDKNMGIWRAVSVTASGAVALRYPHVITTVDTVTLRSADLSISVEARNQTAAAVQGTLSGVIGRGPTPAAVTISQPVTLGPNETKIVRFTPAQFPRLHMAAPSLWWPAELGEPALYDLTLTFQAGGQVSDVDSVRFGIRQITSELTPQGGRLFRINGRRLLIRGGGWAPDMMMRAQPDRQDAELRYVRDMRLNTIRLEGKLEDEHFFDLTDQYGILVLAGWSCCDAWERWTRWRAQDTVIAAQSQRDQIRRLRNRPSVLAWLNGSDNPPPAKVESTYVAILAQYEWQSPVISSATGKRATTGPSGVKMPGPYDWVPPSYWLLDNKNGGALGFNSETSPGPAVPPIESLRAMLPADHLWPIDSVWSFHAGGGQFSNITAFTSALGARYGAAASAEDFAAKSQLMTYEGQRAMFEAYARNKYSSTGVIQWMLNDAWPSLIWHLYDYYLRPGGGYFGSKKALEPVHVMYSYDDGSVVVVNQTNQRLAGVTVRARVFAPDLSEQRDTALGVTVAADTSQRVFAAPKLRGPATMSFLDLRLTDAAGRLVSSNLYWLSATPDELDLEKSTWFITPTRGYANFSALGQLSPATVTSSVRYQRSGADEVAHVTLTNAGKSLAFFVRLQMTRGPGGADVLPVLWQDNYVSLMPGESREISASYRVKDLGAVPAALVVTPWNGKK